MNNHLKPGLERSSRALIKRLIIPFPVVLTVSMLLFPIKPIESKEKPPPGIKLLIADFDDNTGDPDLAVRIKPILHQTLQQSDRLAVYPEIKIRRFLKEHFETSDAGLTLSRARNLSLIENIPVILLPGINRLGKSLVISAKLIHVNEKRELFVDTLWVKDLKHLAVTIENLGKRIRQSLGENRESPAMAGNIFATETAFKTLDLFSQSLSYYSYRSPGDAIERLKNVLALDPDMTVAQLYLGMLYLRLQKPREALVYISQAKDNPGNLPLKYRYLIDGLDHILMHRYAEATAQFNSYAAEFPYDWQAFFQLGQCAVVLGNYSLAVEEYRKAVVLDDTRIESRIGLGLALLYNRDSPGARKILEEASRLTPEDPEIMIALGSLDLVENNPRYAIQAFEKTSPSPLYRSRSMMLLAQANIYRGKFKDALELLAEGIKEDRKSRDAAEEASKRLARARIFLLTGSIPDAVAECLEVPDTGNNPVIIAELGAILAETGRLDDAEKMLLRLRSIPPSSFIEALADRLQGEILSSEGNLREALQSFLRAKESLGTPSVSLARILMRAKQWESAAAEFTDIREKKAAMLFPHNRPWFAGTWVQALYDAGQCSLQANNTDEAKQYFRQYLWVMEQSDPSLETPKKAEILLTGNSL